MRFVPESLRSLLAGALLFGAAACSSSPDAPPGGECVNDCESNLWPRLIVDVPASGDAGTAPPVQLSVRYADGRVAAGNAGGCPEVDNVLCTVSFGATPSDTQVVLRAERAGQAAVEKDISLAPFNYCGREIAYVVVQVDGSGAPQVGPTRYLSPCSGLK